MTDYVDATASKHLFLVRPDEIDILKRRIPSAEANILVKPVGRCTLVTYLGIAISNSLSADKDELLQSLIEANLKLQRYEQSRMNFLARAVHDFWAPLTALGGYCGLLLAEPLGPLNTEQKEVVRRMQKSAKTLSRMTSA